MIRTCLKTLENGAAALWFGLEALGALTAVATAAGLAAAAIDLVTSRLLS